MNCHYYKRYYKAQAELYYLHKIRIPTSMFQRQKMCSSIFGGVSGLKHSHIYINETAKDVFLKLNY